MIGTFVNAGTIVAGSLIGGFLKKGLNEKITGNLMDAMGFAAFGLGINSIVQNMDMVFANKSWDRSIPTSILT